MMLRLEPVKSGENEYIGWVVDRAFKDAC